MAVEAPTYDRALLQLRLHGMEVLPIPVEDDGMDVAALEQACAAGAGPAAALHDPQLPEPLRRDALGRQARRALAEVCDRFGILVLEDDPYGKLRFEGEALPGLFEAEGLDRVIFTSSFSKTVAPGLRVGYLVAPPDLSARLAAAASRTYISPALLAEAAIHALIEGGHLPGNIARVTGLMRERRDAMVAGLRHMPEGTRCVPPAGGFFCWLTLPEGLSADDLFDDAAQAGISYVKGSDCVARGRRAHAEAGLQRREPLRDRGGHGAARGGLPRRPRSSVGRERSGQAPAGAGPGRDR